MNTSTAAPRHHLSYQEALAGLRAAQKPGQGVPAYTRWVNRPLARRAAARAAADGLTANAVTGLSAVLSAAGLAVLVTIPPTVVTGLVVAVLLAAGYVMDSADGQVARLTGTGSSAGEWLDHVVDSVRTPAIHLAVLASWLVHGVPAGTAPVLAFGLPMLFVLVETGQFMSQILAEQLRRRGGIGGPSTGGTLRSFLNLPTDAGVTCWVFVLWGVPAVFVPAYAALLLALAAIAAVSMRRKYLGLVPRPAAAPADPSAPIPDRSPVPSVPFVSSDPRSASDVH